MLTILLIVVLVLTGAALAIVTGFIARARGRRFWFWALLELLLPFVGLLAVIILPRPGSR